MVKHWASNRFSSTRLPINTLRRTADSLAGITELVPSRLRHIPWVHLRQLHMPTLSNTCRTSLGTPLGMYVDCSTRLGRSFRALTKSPVRPAWRMAMCLCRSNAAPVAVAEQVYQARPSATNRMFCVTVRGGADGGPSRQHHTPSRQHHTPLATAPIRDLSDQSEQEETATLFRGSTGGGVATDGLARGCHATATWPYGVYGTRTSAVVWFAVQPTTAGKRCPCHLATRTGVVLCGTAYHRRRTIPLPSSDADGRRVLRYSIPPQANKTPAI